jgi:hypothetical protein
VPLVLRGIRFNRWYKNPVQDFPWLPPGELPGDSLGDIAPQRCMLSVYLIENDHSNLWRVIAALAANQTSPSHFGFAVIDLQVLNDMGFKLSDQPGDTADDAVNSWHRDIVELSDTRLLALAQAIQTQGLTDQILEKEVHNWITRSLYSNYLDPQKIKITSERLRLKFGLPPKK